MPRKKTLRKFVMFRNTLLAGPIASAFMLLGTVYPHQASAAQFSTFFSAEPAPLVAQVRDGGGRFMGGGGGGGGGRSFGGGGGGGFSGRSGGGGFSGGGGRSFGGGGGFSGGGARSFNSGGGTRSFNGSGSGSNGGRSFGGGFSGGNRFSGGSAVTRRDNGGGAFVRRGGDGRPNRTFVFQGGDGQRRFGSAGDGSRRFWKGDGKRWAGNDYDRGHKGRHHHRRHRYFARSLFLYPGYYDWGYDTASYEYDCEWLRQRALYTGSRYWWWRYQVCSDWY
jgi:hypothetical protein